MPAPAAPPKSELLLNPENWADADAGINAKAAMVAVERRNFIVRLLKLPIVPVPLFGPRKLI